MIERKIIKSDMQSVNDVINEWQAFGWTVESTSSNEYVDTYNDINTVKTITGKVKGYELVQHKNYVNNVTITFARDSAMENINQLRQLENDYINTEHKYLNTLDCIERQKKERFYISSLFIVAYIVSVMICFFMPTMDLVDSSTLLVILAFIGIIIITPVIFYCLHKNKNIKKLKDASDTLAKQGKTILSIARSYLR